ncbi:hypothetical protein TL16_g04794 [Triparma laevis f. inornata]|uniref:CENP-V/GFA domain-containing protein n=1 Tax=Triparma laevis f. inornata TaxID=1714386 RepID=A0A9W7AC17_9STRA|nr:hypothetical protein TL16_g04794 [Triparma laevis f. inornata]
MSSYASSSPPFTPPPSLTTLTCTCTSCTISIPSLHSPHLYHCFCSTCTLQSGQTFQSFLTYPSYPHCPVEIEGVYSSYNSSDDVERIFCTTCGCNIGCIVSGKNIFYVNAGLHPDCERIQSERAIFVPPEPNVITSIIINSLKQSNITLYNDYGGIDLIDYTFSPSLPPSNIIFFGTACVDKLTYINEFNRNSKIGVEKILKQAGGNSGNAACACRGLIDGVGVVTKVGEDEDGVFVVEELNKRNIGTGDVIKSYSGVTLEVNVIVEKGGGRTCLSLPREVIVEDITREEVEGIEGKVDWVVFDGRHIDSALIYARQVKENGGKIVVEAEMRSRSHQIKAAMDNLMGLADYVVMGSDFLNEFYAGSTPLEKCETWSKSILGTKKWLIITRGDKGAYIYYSTLLEVKPFYIPSESIIDSTGAGDCFLGVLVAFLIKGISVDKAVEAGNWAGMMQLRGEGGRVEIDWNLAKGVLSWMK